MTLTADIATSLDAELARYRYGTQRLDLQVTRINGIPYTLVLQKWVTDARDPDQKVKLYSAIDLAHVERLGVRDGMQAAVRELVQQMELHEVDEHLRYDGQLLHDPHTPGFMAPVVVNNR